MKKLLLLVLASLSLPCFGVSVRVNIIARGEPVVLSAEFDESTYKAATPFVLIDEKLNAFLQRADVSGQQVVQEVDGQAHELEFVEPIILEDVDPVILSIAISLESGVGPDINSLNPQTITQLIDLYNYLTAHREIIFNSLLECSVDFAIKNPLRCSFGGDFWAREHNPLLDNEHNMIRGVLSVAAARKKVSDYFSHECLPYSPWIRSCIRGHRGVIWSFAWAPNGARVAVVSSDHTVRIWDAKTGCLAAQLCGERVSQVRCLAYSPDGRIIVTGSFDDGIVRVWDPETGELLRESLKAHNGSVASVKWSHRSGLLATGAADNTVRVWKLEEGWQRVKTFVCSGCVTALEWSPDDRFLATCSDDHAIHIWDIRTGQNVGRLLEMYNGSISSLAWSPDGNAIAIGMIDGNVRTCDVQTWRHVNQFFERHRMGVSSITWSPDGRFIATGSDDSIVRIWDTLTRQKVSEMFSAKAPLWSPDERLIATGLHDYDLCIWWQEWRWLNWTTDRRVDGNQNLLKQLLMLKIERKPKLTPEEGAELRPIYCQLPYSAGAWVLSRINGSM